MTIVDLPRPAHEAATPTTILPGDCLNRLTEIASGAVQCCVTSPPYWGLRDYGDAEQIGQESSPEEYVAHLVDVFREVRRCLADHGTLWVNVGDAYAGPGGGGGCSGEMSDRAAAQLDVRRTPAKRGAGLKRKDLIMLPAMLAMALRADGWWLRDDIIWLKTNPSPESCRDRCTRSYEHLFLLSKRPIYYFDDQAIDEAAEWDRAAPGARRRRRNVWSLPTQPFPSAHFATMPVALADLCIRAGSRTGDLVLDPFLGAGTTALAANRIGRLAVGSELNSDYVDIAVRRLEGEGFAAAVFDVEPVALAA